MLRIGFLYSIKGVYAICMLGITVTVGRFWGAEALGMLGVSLTLITIAVSFGSFGGHYRGVEVGARPGWEADSAAWALVAQSSLFGSASGLLLFVIGHRLWGVSAVVIVCAGLGASLVACCGMYIGAERQVLSSVLDNGMRILAASCLLGLSLILDFGRDLQNELVLLGLFVVPSVVAVLVLAKDVGWPSRGLRTLISFPLSALLLSCFGVFEVLTAQVDRLIVGHLLGPSLVGIYTASQNILNIVLYAVVVANALAMPRLVGLAKDPSSWNSRRYRQVVRLVALFAGLVTAGSIVLGSEVLSLYGDPYRVGASSLSIMLGGLTVSLCFGFPIAALLLNGQRGIGLLLSASSVIIIVALCYFLIPRFGLVGAAVAYAVGAVFLKSSAFAWLYFSVGVNTSIVSRRD